MCVDSLCFAANSDFAPAARRFVVGWWRALGAHSGGLRGRTWTVLLLTNHTTPLTTPTYSTFSHSHTLGR